MKERERERERERETEKEQRVKKEVGKSGLISSKGVWNKVKTQNERAERK